MKPAERKKLILLGALACLPCFVYRHEIVEWWIGLTMFLKSTVFAVALAIALLVVVRPLIRARKVR